MDTKNILERIKPFYTFLLIVVISSIFFGLGRLSTVKQGSSSIRILSPNTEQAGLVLSTFSTSTNKGIQDKQVLVAPLSQSGEVVGSKTGKKYYFPWCGTAKRIKPENQIHFTTVEEAKNAGYTAGGNCKGLK
jgi:hypothetical protein